MEVKIFAFIGIIVFFIGGLILASIQSFEKNINKKIDKLNDKIGDIGLKTNYIDSQHEDVYTKLNLLSLMLNDLRKSQNNINNNNNEPKSEK